MPTAFCSFAWAIFSRRLTADAELIARELDVVLTSRPIAKDTRIPMAGVPHHAAEGYIARLIEKGYRVAMADQIGSEAMNGLVPREVRRVITPGTVVEPGMLEASRPNYLAAVVGAIGRLEMEIADASQYSIESIGLCLLRYHDRRVLGRATGKRALNWSARWPAFNPAK